MLFSKVEGCHEISIASVARAEWGPAVVMLKWIFGTLVSHQIILQTWEGQSVPCVQLVFPFTHPLLTWRRRSILSWWQEVAS